jgi:putative addiction module killer protein
MVTMRRTGEFDKWLKNLRDSQAKARILTRIKRLAEGNPGDSRFLGEISELRIDYGPGYRIYSKVWFNTPGLAPARITQCLQKNLVLNQTV